MRDKYIVFSSDSQAVVEIINRQTSKDFSLMALLRRFVLCTLKFNIFFMLNTSLVVLTARAIFCLAYR